MRIETTEELLKVIKETPTLTDNEISLLVRLTTKSIVLPEFYGSREELIEALEDFFTRYQNNERPIFVCWSLSVKNE